MTPANGASRRTEHGEAGAEAGSGRTPEARRAPGGDGVPAPRADRDRCPRCGAAVGCALETGSGEPCWCTRLPAAATLPLEPARPSACLCPACLAEALAASAAGPRSRPA